MKISLCMIVKNEEKTLARCLESAGGLADEIIVVDTGSDDGTPAIAAQCGAVHSFAWTDDFAAARNYAFSLASGDYLFWLDADDVLPPSEREKFPALRALLEEAPDAVLCPYEVGGAVFYRERFLRRAANFSWRGRVHECIEVRGNVVRFDLRISHRGEALHTARNLQIYRKWAEEEPLAGRDLFYFGRELSDGGEYKEAEAVLTRFLQGGGWYVNKIEACKTLSLCLLKTRGAAASLAPLYRSLEYGAPRASVLCEIAARLSSLARPREAVFWYRAAMLCEDHAAEGDFELPACRDLIPLLGLVVCHWALGEREEAFSCHKKTEAIAPRHPSVLYNKNFFAAQHISDSASS